MNSKPQGLPKVGNVIISTKIQNLDPSSDPLTCNDSRPVYCINVVGHFEVFCSIHVGIIASYSSLISDLYALVKNKWSHSLKGLLIKAILLSKTINVLTILINAPLVHYCQQNSTQGTNLSKLIITHNSSFFNQLGPETG